MNDTETGDSRHGGYGHECWDGCDAMTDDKPTCPGHECCICGKPLEHRGVCADPDDPYHPHESCKEVPLMIAKPTEGLPACGSKYCGPGKAHAEGCDYIETPVAGESTEQPTGGLTEKEIDDAFKKGSGLWPSGLADRTHWSIDTKRIRAGLREVEAIVRKDERARYVVECQFEDCDQDAALCKGHIEQDVKEAKTQARKDERERAAAICKAMTGDRGAAAAILRGES